jgi:hypothetical protein
VFVEIMAIIKRTLIKKATIRINFLRNTFVNKMKPRKPKNKSEVNRAGYIGKKP